MKHHSLLQRIIHKISEKLVPILYPIRRKKINNTDFTIISNNCWGGKCYEFFQYEKKSPTIGSYFFAKDYIKFIYNLKDYLSKEIEIIGVNESKYKDELIRRGQANVPIGKLGDIEVVFLHYKDPVVAKEKWNRRIKRVNFDNIIFKFSYMNDCTEKELEDFSKISGVKKIMFVGKNNKKYKDSYVIPTGEKGQIEDDTFFWRKYVNIYKIINSPKTSLDNMIIDKDK